LFQVRFQFENVFFKAKVVIHVFQLVLIASRSNN